MEKQPVIRESSRRDEVAAKFEDCLQLFERLLAYIAQLPRLKNTEIFENTHEAFITWGRASGAVAQTIDRALRKSTRLSQRTLDLLEKIYSKIEQAIDKIESSSLVNESVEEEDLTLSRDDSILNRDEDALLTLIKHVDRLVTCLEALLPHLRNPFPIDLYSPYGSVLDAYPDIELARTQFFSASPALLTRLGSANWRRRKYLKKLRDQSIPETPGIALKTSRLKHRRLPIRELAVDAFNFQKPALKTAMNLPEKSRIVTRVSSKTSLIGGSEGSQSLIEGSEAAQSTLGGSVFSKFGLRLHGSVITVFDSDSVKDASQDKERNVPQPPIPLDSGQAFLCPYCLDVIGQGVNNITDIQGWKKHVIDDLQPYMCTFDDCLQASMTFSDRESWFQHETANHRAELISNKILWSCQYCREDFETAAIFENHLRQQHRNVCGPLQIKCMLSMCAKSPNSFKEYTCPLCLRKTSAPSLKEHVASHLEQFALLSIDDDSSSVFSETSDAEINSVGSDLPTKLKILNSFVEEQFGLLLPSITAPPDDSKADSDLNLVGISDDEDEAALEIKEEGLQRVETLLNDYQVDPEVKSSERSNNPALRTINNARDYVFVGRDDYLARLYKVLSVPGRICTLNGPGGSGKTAIAVEYTYRYEPRYSYIFWIQAETRFGCSDTFGHIAIVLGLGSHGDGQTHLIETGQEFLERSEKQWLLVFDNVDSWEDIEEYIPTELVKTKGSVLITSRRHNIGPRPRPQNYFCISLTEMHIEEARFLLIRNLSSGMQYENAWNHPEWKAAAEVAGLAGLPLALIQIAGFVSASGSSLAELLELWDEWRRSTLPEDGETSKENALEIAWDIGLTDIGSDTLKLLKIMAFLDGNSIQKDLLISNHQEPSLRFLNSSQVFRCRRMIMELNNRKLLSIKNLEGRVIFSVHRLLQQRLLRDLEKNESEKGEIFDLAFKLIRERVPHPSIKTSNSADWSIVTEYLPHVLAILELYKRQPTIVKPLVSLAELFRDGGVHLWQRGIHSESLRLLVSAEEILNHLVAQEYQLRVDIHIAIGLLIQKFGISHRAESRDRFQSILTIRERLAKDAATGISERVHEMELCKARADYGNALLQFNEYKVAEQIYHQCNAKYDEWGAEDDITLEIGKLYHHMAFCKMYYKDFLNAIGLSEAAIEYVSRMQNHQQLILQYKFDLACIILQSGNIEKSVEMQQEILRERLNLQGKGGFGSFTLQSYYAVGASYAFLGKLDEAEYAIANTSLSKVIANSTRNYMRTALHRARHSTNKGVWSEAAVARTEFHLAQVLKKKGKEGEEAEELLQRASSVLSRLLPWDPMQGVQDGDELVLYDHLQSVFDGRFTGIGYLKYVGIKP